MTKQFHDVLVVSSSSCANRNKSYHMNQSGNHIKGVLTSVEADITLPSGRKLFTRKKAGENTMLIGATQKIAKYLVGSGTEIKIHTLDEELKSTLTAQQTVSKEDQVYCGVLLSNGGAEGSVVNAVDRYGCGFDKASMIPWRIVPTTSENAGELYKDYACRSVEGSDAKYYLKKLKSVTFLNRTIDGETQLTDRPDQQLSGHEAVETIIKTGFTITLEDLAEYYKTLGDVQQRKFSKISLFLGNTITVNVNGSHSDHRKLMCANQLNIEEEYLKQNKEATYDYTIHIR